MFERDLVLEEGKRNAEIKYIGEGQVAVARVVAHLAHEVRIRRGIARGGDDLLGGAALAGGDLLVRGTIGAQPT